MMPHRWRLVSVVFKGKRYMVADDMRQAVAWVLDGVGPIPAEVAGWLAQLGEGDRIAKCGKVLAVVAHDFGAPVGVARVVVCEKWAGLVVPGAAGAWHVQGLHLAQAAAILAAHK